MLFPKFPTGLEARDSGEYHFVKGQVRRRKKQVWIRGLNQDYNRDLKGLFKAAALRASGLRSEQKLSTTPKAIREVSGGMLPQRDRTGNRDAFAVGEPGAVRVRARGDRGACAEWPADRERRRKDDRLKCPGASPLAMLPAPPLPSASAPSPPSPASLRVAPARR
jgi:hypothetical protein